MGVRQGFDLSLNNVACVLVVENEPLIAMDVEAMLFDAGVGAVHHVQSCRDALDWLSGNRPEVVILDLHLHDGPGAIVAEALQARATPFIIYSGDTHTSASLSDVTKHAPWLNKPCTQEDLIHAVRRSLGLAL